MLDVVDGPHFTLQELKDNNMHVVKKGGNIFRNIATEFSDLLKIY
jgi:hypothetical protein